MIYPRKARDLRIVDWTICVSCCRASLESVWIPRACEMERTEIEQETANDVGHASWADLAEFYHVQVVDGPISCAGLFPLRFLSWAA